MKKEEIITPSAPADSSKFSWFILFSLVNFLNVMNIRFMETECFYHLVPFLSFYSQKQQLLLERRAEKTKSCTDNITASVENISCFNVMYLRNRTKLDVFGFATH